MTTQRKNRIITIQSRVVARDVYGGEVVHWVDYATEWASVVTQGRADERFVAGADRQLAGKAAAMRLRYRRDIDETMRVVYDDYAWDIEGIAEVGYRDDLELYCVADTHEPPIATTPISIRGGLSMDNLPQPTDFRFGHHGGAIDFGTFFNMYLLIWRLATEDDITTVVFESDSTRQNQIGAFTKYAHTVSIGGQEGNVWVSNNRLTFTLEHNVLEVA